MWPGRERLETEVVAIRSVNPGRNRVWRERQFGKGYLAGAIGPLADRDHAAGLIGVVEASDRDWRAEQRRRGG